MIPAISSAPVTHIAAAEPLSTGAVSGQSGFPAVLQRAMESVESTGAQAETAAEGFLSGTSTDVHSAALAAQRAALQFEYALQVRNKIVQAYQEVMRMQL